ncbi:MAG TPA: amino acid adenylation domain-containing protein [Halomicronema sp.]
MKEINQRIAQLSPAKRKLLEQKLQQKAKNVNHQPTITPREKTQSAPLSFFQERMWILDKIEPGNPAYNCPINIRITGSLNLAALEKAINQIVERHEVLRTSFPTVDEQPIQVIATSLNVKLPRINLTHLSIKQQTKEVEGIALEEAQHKFDLSILPLIKAKLLHLSETENILLLTMHHIIFDGWSIAILLKEIAAYYELFVNGEPSRLPPLPIQYADFAIWQRQRLEKEKLEPQLAYWKKQLGGSAAVLNLPTDRPRKPVQTFRGAKQDLVLPKHLCDSLKELSLREEVTLFMTLLAAFQILLYRYTGQEDIVIGTPIAGRDRLETENLIGAFINTLVIRCRFNGNATFAEVLTQVRQVALDAFEHQELPFEKLVAELQPERNLSQNPIFQVLFQLRNFPNPTLTAAGVTLERCKFDRGIAALDLTLDIAKISKGLVCSFEYNSDVFEAATIKRMCGHFQVLLEAIVANPQQPVSQLPLLTERERHQLLVEWNDTAAYYPHDKCIHQLFEEQVERTPDAIAVVFKSEKLTYCQLNNRANQLAHYLQKLGVGPEVLVGICVERSFEMIVGLLGILKAGGAYVPIDPTYPSERIAYMLKDTQLPVLLTQKKLVASLPEHQGQIICLDSDWEKISKQSELSPISRVQPTNLAYIIYTSGSTGKPKGVQVCHRGLCNLATAEIQLFKVQADSRVLQFFSLSFDISIGEILMVFCAGATLCLATPEHLHPGQPLLKLLEKEKITNLSITPSALAALPIQKLPTLQTIVAGGEPCPRKLVSQWTLGRQFFNAYGPTETTVYATFAQCFESIEIVPIGRPIYNTQIYILDRYLQPVPIGVPGEVHIAGVGVARGYLNRPDLTKEKFIPNPFSNKPASRLYKTGDLARYLPDGNIEYLGRIDNQVKIRGFRIELGEIETVLNQHPNILESLVIADKKDISGDKRLVAYIVPTQEKIPTIEILRHFLKQKLPNYMIPAFFVILKAFPLNPNGKIDRHALLTPNQHNQTPENTYVAPQTVAEQKLSEIWEKVLGIDHEIGIYDNFFDLGGHSLLSVRLVAEIEKVFNQKLPLAALFQLSTIAELAPLLEAEKTTKNAVQKISIPLLPTPSLDPEIYRQLLAYTAGWKGKRIAPNALMVGLNTDGSSQPLFWCVNGFHEIKPVAEYLGTDQPIYGLRSGFQINGFSHENITSLAGHYLQEILTVQPKGPYLIGGYCAGSRIAFEIAQQLQQSGEVVTLLALIETPLVRPKPTPYPGRIALFFGCDSHLNPYKQFQWPEWGWRKFYPGGFSLDLIPSEHYFFESEAYVEIVAEKLQTRIKAAQTFPTPGPILPNQISYDLLPDLAYQAQLTTSNSLLAQPAEVMNVKVTVKNISPVVWPDSKQSGIALGNHWLDNKGNVICWSDSRVALPQYLPPNAEVLLSLSIKMPQEVGEYILELDLVEEGVMWFHKKGSKTTRVNVKVSNQPLLNFSTSQLEKIKADLGRSRSLLSQIKTFLE